MNQVIKLFAVSACAVTFCALQARAQTSTLPIADFENGVSGLEGSITRDETTAKNGKASGRVEARLATVNQNPWITIRKPLDLRNIVKSVSLWVKSAEAKTVTVQIVDATGQTLQVRPQLKPGAEWQFIKIDSFEGGAGFQSWGGANDKRVHWPIGFLNFIVEKNGLEGGNGTVWLDDISLETEGAPKSVTPTLDEVTAGTKRQMLADFETDSGGFAGQFSRDTDEGQNSKASAKMEADFSNAGQSPWITASRSLDIKAEIKALSFWAKSNAATQLTVRVVDASGQNLQQRPNITPDGQWHQITLTSFESGTGFQSWGGANDKKVHWPAQKLEFILEKNGLQNAKGALLIDNVEAYVSTEKLAGKLDLKQEKLGNVFLTNEPVRIPVDTQGDTVAWKAMDFWGQSAGEGEATVTDKSALIAPDIKRQGYFQVHLTAKKNGAPLAEADTAFVVTSPLDLAAVPSSPFGVMTHFAQNWDVDIMPLIARMGAKNIRDELYWGQVEEKKGEYRFREQFDKYMAAAKANNIDPLIILSFANGNYDGGNTPYTPEGNAAYARYAQEVLKKYGTQIKAVEIWNEYNGSFAKGPVTQDRPKYYTQMLKTAYEAVKQARPDVKVVGISAVSIPFPYFQQIFDDGSLQYLDAVSLHPYRSYPEGLDRSLGRLQEMIKKHNAGKTRPLWITEVGWGSNTDTKAGAVVTEADQAKYLARTYALSLATGGEKVFWYLLRDYDVFATMGLLHGPESKMGRYVPKPAYAAFAAMARQLNGANFDQRENTLREDVYSLRFRRGAEEVRVVWAANPTTLTVKTAAPLTATDLMGETKTLTPAGGEVSLALSDTPIYVQGKITALPPMSKEAGERLAQSEEDFSNVQGADGWSYGFFVASAPGGPYNPAEFKPFPTYQVTPWNYEWINADIKYLTLTPANAHPGVQDGKPVWAVRRYVSKAAGNLRLQGSAARPNMGDGTTVRILADGKEVWKQQVGGDHPQSTKFDVTVPAKAGSLIDFAIDPGPAADTSYDATSFTATVTRLP